MDAVRMLGDKIKQARKEQNLSQEELAGDTFTKSYISKIERGMVNPSMKALEIISSRLGKPVAYFMADSSRDEYDPRMLTDAQKLFEMKKYKESLERLKEILKYKERIDPDQLTRIYYYITDLCIRLEQYEACIQYYEEAFRLCRDVSSVYAVKIHLELGEAYYYLNRRQDSLDIFLKVEKMIEDYTFEIDIITRLELYNDIAILCSQLGNKEQGESYFKKVIELSKRYKIITDTVLSAYSGLAQISVIYEKNADKSLSYLNSDILSLYTYFEDYNRLGEIYLKYSNAYYEKDDVEGFREYLKKLEEIMPKMDDNKGKAELEVYFTLYKGKLASKEERYEEAESYMQKAMELANANNNLMAITSIYLNLGRLYLSLSKYSDALRYLDKCEALSDEIQFSIRLPELYQLMGKVHLQLGNPAKAQVYYDRAFKLLK